MGTVSGPLSPWLYFLRNSGRVLPMGFVIVLSVFLIASVAAIANSIDLTVRTIYRYTEFFTYVLPQRTFRAVPDDQKALIKADPRTGRMIEGSFCFINIKTVIGRLPFVLLGIEKEDREFLIQRMGAHLLEGRMPADGMPEAVISRPIAENRHIGVGDTVAGPLDEGGVAGAPMNVKVVGILDGPIWIAFTSKRFVDATFLLNPRCTLVTTTDPKQLDGLNRALMPVTNKRAGLLQPEKVQVLSRDNLISEIRDSLSSMYLIMEIVSGAVIFVIALMSGMLSNIYFTQRITEFGVLSAIGYARSRLVGRIVAETALLTTIGWAVGAVITYWTLRYLADSVFKGRGLFLDPTDLWAYEHTLPIPVAITFFAVLTIGTRLMRLDPVTIIERR